MWLCLHLPRCALDALGRYLPAGDVPTAVIERRGGRRAVVAADARATALGVAPGQWLTAARARVPTLVAWTRDTDSERALLQGLATRCLNYTSHVHRPPPPPDPGAGRLLLEVGGSLGLFDGLESLTRRVRAELAAAGHDLLAVPGRTPGLAMLRARARAAGHTDPPRALPLDLLELAPATLDALAAAGLVTVGDVLALPRGALARRHGPECLDYLDRLTGRKADPRPPLRPPRRFDAGLELPAEVTNTAALRFPLDRLTGDLVATLRGLDAAVPGLRLSLRHADAPPTRLALSFAAPTRDADRIVALLNERLDSLALPAPVRALRLTADRFVSHVPAQRGLFENRERDTTAWHELLDRLHARLGEAALSQPQCRADHRPERAAAAAPPDSEPGSPAAGERPTWLLARPRPLSRAPDLLRGPERIESGWWETDQRRDYYVARDREGRRVWVFREARPPHRWFLHGVFA